MKSRDDRHSERVGAQCSRLTAAARTSCEETAEHVKSSREKVARSLHLLGATFSRLAD